MISIENLHKYYSVSSLFGRAQKVHALRGVSLSLSPKETLAIVGESGCGKSTLARLVMGLEEPSIGRISFAPQNSIQMIFQDPHSSLNPRWKIKKSIAEPLRILGASKIEIEKKVSSLAGLVGLRPEWLERYPHMLSGGQKQRVGIARALVTSPKILVCDEPVSALDVSVQAQVLNLLVEIKEKMDLSLIFISHDLNVVRFIADRVAVLYLGQVVETGTTERVFSQPSHPYTQLLLSSAPQVYSNRNSNQKVSFNLDGEIPSPLKPPSGCAFRSRCLWSTNQCENESPKLENYNGAEVACFNKGKND
jgi:oligopeptide/dipeptide ABC transporter ATP-binding protein